MSTVSSKKNLATSGTLADLRFDPQNANRGTEYGTHLLRKSIQELGVGRGIVAASDGTIVGGNHVTEMLSELGIEDVIFVPTDGRTLVVTQRMDIEPGTKAFHELAIADNKVGLANLDFDVDVVGQLGDAFDIDLEAWGLDYKEDAPKAKQEADTSKPCSITFSLTNLDMQTLRRALDTALVEGAIASGQQADSLSLLRIIDEFLAKRDERPQA